MQNNNAQEILEKIKSSNNILINMDTRTDYDALSSSMVLSKYINEIMGLKATLIHAQKLTEKFDKFFPHEQVIDSTDISSLDLSKYDLIIFLDSGARVHVSLNNDFEIPKDITTINIDHHEDNDFFGTLNYVYHYGSCCSVLYEFFKELNIKLHQEYLEILKVGLVTDTGSFRFDSTTPTDFRIAAELLEKGVKISEVSTKLTNDEYLDQIKYKQIIYKNLKVDFDKKYAYSTISLAELNDAGIDLTKVYVRHSVVIEYIIGIDYCFVIAETNSDPKYFEISFRAKNPEFNVSDLAAKFGGGGHPTASGAKLYDVNSIEEATKKVLTTLNL